MQGRTATSRTVTSRDRQGVTGLFLLITGAALALTMFLPSSAQSPGENDDDASANDASRDRMRVILQRNIFAPRRTRPQPSRRPEYRRPETREERSESTGPRFVETSKLLKGVILREDAFVAFIEDPRSGETTLMKTGEPLMNGKIVGIDIDGISFELDGETTRVAVGQSVRGKRQVTDGSYAERDEDDGPREASNPSQTATSEGEASDTSDADRSADVSPSNDNNSPSRTSSGRESLLEQMRRRRQQELQ